MTHAPAQAIGLDIHSLLKCVFTACVVALSCLMPSSIAWAQELDFNAAPSPHLPPVQHVQNRALRVAGMTLQVPSFTRMRMSNLIPTVELNLGWAQRADDESRYREDLNRLDEGALARDFIRQDTHQTQDHTRTVRVRLKFDLSKLIFDPRELQWTRLRTQQHALRAKMMRDVATLYWRRRHHELELAFAPKDDVEMRIKHHIQVQLHTAQLDALTGGWFSKSLAQRARKGGTP